MLRNMSSRLLSEWMAFAAIENEDMKSEGLKSQAKAGLEGMKARKGK